MGQLLLRVSMTTHCPAVCDGLMSYRKSVPFSLATTNNSSKRKESQAPNQVTNKQHKAPQNQPKPDG
jgi:hypothetical protein